MVIVYNSKLARLIIPTFKMILICFVLLCKKDSSYYTENEIDHERCHCKQWFALFVLGIVLWLLIGTFSSYWLTLLSIITFYMWYGVEFLIRFLIKFFIKIKNEGFLTTIKVIKDLGHSSYREIAFEKEAYAVEKGEVECHYVSFLHYY